MYKFYTNNTPNNVSAFTYNRNAEMIKIFNLHSIKWAKPTIKVLYTQQYIKLILYLNGWHILIFLIETTRVQISFSFLLIIIIELSEKTNQNEQRDVNLNTQLSK